MVSIWHDIMDDNNTTEDEQLIDNNVSWQSMSVLGFQMWMRTNKIKIVLKI